MRPTAEWDRLPRFINGNAADDRTFVLHLHWPRFLAEIFEDDSCDLGKPLWIDEPEGMSEADLAKLLREAGDFYTNEADRE
jgi:hypothetical protein